MGNRFASEYGPWAIVTGASSGIGEAFAHALAERGVASVLVARRESELTRVADDIHRDHGLQCRTLTVDLADAGFAKRLTESVSDLDIGLVIGNAAFNPVGAFSDMSSETLNRIIDVNDRANVLLANAFLPLLSQRERGGLLLVASTEAFVGMPYSACYSASKAFVLSLGEALWGEMQGTGIDVLVLAPSATETPLLASRDMGNLKVHVMSPGEVANIGLDNLPKGPCVIPGTQNKLMFGTMRLLPRRYVIRKMGKTLKQVLLRSRKRSAAQ